MGMGWNVDAGEDAQSLSDLTEGRAPGYDGGLAVHLDPSFTHTAFGQDEVSVAMVPAPAWADVDSLGLVPIEVTVELTRPFASDKQPVVTHRWAGVEELDGHPEFHT